MTVEEILTHWGWVGVLLVWFVPRAWTFVTEKWFPRFSKSKDNEEQERAKKIERENREHEEAARAEREARATLLRAQIEREAREDKRQERVTLAIEQISIAMVSMDGKLSTLLQGQTQHIQFTLTAHNDMIEKIHNTAALIQTDQRLDSLERKISDTQQRAQVAT